MLNMREQLYNYDEKKVNDLNTQFIMGNEVGQFLFVGWSKYWCLRIYSFIKDLTKMNRDKLWIILVFNCDKEKEKYSLKPSGGSIGRSGGSLDPPLPTPFF